MKHKLLNNLLRFLISFGFIIGCSYFLKDKWRTSIDLIRNIHLELFGFAAMIYVVSIMLVCVRLFLILKVEHIKTPLHRVIQFSLIGQFFNLFLPSSLGGDVVKTYYLAKGFGSTVRAASAVIIDRFLGLVAMVLLALSTVPFFLHEFHDVGLTLVILCIGLVLVMAAVLMWNPRVVSKLQHMTRIIPSGVVKEKMKELYHAMTRFRQHPRYLIAGLGLSLVVQLISIVIGYVIAQSLSIDVNFMVFMLIIPVSAIASLTPSLGGLGVREVSMIFFLTKYSSHEQAAAFALAFDILVYGFGLFCGMLFGIFGGPSQKEIKEIL